MGKIVHFKIPNDNKKNAARFYGKLFKRNANDIPAWDYEVLHVAIIGKGYANNKKNTVKGGLYQMNSRNKELLLLVGGQPAGGLVRKVISAGGKPIYSGQSIPNGSFTRILDGGEISRQVFPGN